MIALAVVGSLIFFGDPAPVALAFSPDHRLLVTARGTVYSYTGGRLDRAANSLPPPTSGTATFPPLPTGSRATHVSAYAAGHSMQILAAYEEGLWERRGGPWQRLAVPGLERVRALAVNDDQFAATTEAGEIWSYRQGRWQKLETPSGPTGSIYGLATFHGKLFAASFENGISVKQGSVWHRVMPPIISTPHARDFVTFRDRLYVRYSTGEVDRFDGKTWAKNVFPWLLRGGATCLFASQNSLWVGQYGGYSQFDGTRWTHDLKRPQLSNAVTTELFASQNTAWLGTQDRGLFRISGSEIRQFDQRQGLGDDWIRHIYATGQDVYVGLFRTGAYRLVDDQFVRITPAVQNEVTGLIGNPDGSVTISSREGLFAYRKGQARTLDTGKFTEVQTMTRGSSTSLWLGLPTGIALHRGN